MTVGGLSPFLRPGQHSRGVVGGVFAELVEPGDGFAGGQVEQPRGEGGKGCHGCGSPPILIDPHYPNTGMPSSKTLRSGWLWWAPRGAGVDTGPVVVADR